MKAAVKLSDPYQQLKRDLKRLSQRLAAYPDSKLYVQRGMVNFKLGQITDSIADFDRAEHLNPNLTPYLWQRGLSYYYANRFAEGAKQFEVDLTVNGHDAEETIWRYLCQAQLQGVEFARQALLPIQNDLRPVMRSLHQLFAGNCTPETVLAENLKAGRSKSFYSHLYVGLYFEAEKNPEKACQYLTQAAAMQVTDDYMGWLAIVHCHLRRWNGLS